MITDIFYIFVQANEDSLIKCLKCADKKFYVKLNTHLNFDKNIKMKVKCIASKNERSLYWRHTRGASIFTKQNLSYYDITVKFMINDGKGGSYRFTKEFIIFDDTEVFKTKF